MRWTLRDLIMPDWIGVWKGWLDICDSIDAALVTLPPKLLARHTYIIGATGSGKTSLMQSMVAADILRGHSIVVLDARGDFANTVVELAANANVDPSLARYFNLRDPDPLGFDGFGGAGEPHFRALGFTAAIASDFESLGVQVVEHLQNAALLLAETGGRITDIDGLFYDRSIRLRLIEAAKTESLKSFWLRFDSLSPDKQHSIGASVRNKLTALICTDSLRRLYGHPFPVDLGEQLRTPGSITLISLAVDQLHEAGWRAGSLFLSSICSEVFSQVDVPESRRNPIRLYVDEFEHFSGDHFEGILAEGRRFGFSVVLAHQSLAQLSPKTRSIILDNAGVKIVLRTSYASAEILNRDLTGFRGTFDIAGLPVGEAILAVRGIGAQWIEINAPIIQESGGLSQRATYFLEQANHLASVRAVDDTNVPDISATANTNGNTASVHEDKPRRPRQGRLEDWLE